MGPSHPRDIPEGGGGGGFFSGMEEGYSVSLHAKIGNPGCISFRFMNFLFSEGGTPPPRDPPGA